LQFYLESLSLKIIVRCHQCGPNEEAALLEIANENLHQVICDKGHESSLVITQQKHEILFEVAVHAIVDGYYREAISSFAASLERYYEFFIKVISVELPCEEFEKAWRQVTSQSERQLGGYIFTYLNIYRTSPHILPHSLITLRNSVIHKGYIPSRVDAITFGEAVAKIINDGCNLLRSTKADYLNEIIRQTICPNNNSKHPTYILRTYLNCLVESELTSFEGYVKSVQTHNQPRF
jgi:hypothetical protein